MDGKQQGNVLAVVDALDKARDFVLGCSDSLVAVDHKPLFKDIWVTANLKFYPTLVFEPEGKTTSAADFTWSILQDFNTVPPIVCLVIIIPAIL